MRSSFGTGNSNPSDDLKWHESNSKFTTANGEIDMPGNSEESALSRLGGLRASQRKSLASKGAASRQISVTRSNTSGERPFEAEPSLDTIAHSNSESAGGSCDSYLSKFVLRENHTYRTWWSMVLAVLLFYTGTVMPYTLCFLEFRLDGAITLGTAWNIINYTVDSLFWFDLFFSFFCSYTDKNGHEVTNFRKVVKNYLVGYFSLNLIACIPTELIELMLSSSSGGEVGSIARLSRMQRIGRLMRLVRLLRLVKIFAFIKDNPVFLWLNRQRGVRIFNFTCGLLWIVHLVACGWYLVAACHTEVEHTWVARREVADGETLMSSGPFYQWLTSMYFVMTVFSTVGFGDISALTVGEIFYAIFAMLLGAIVHGMIMSEVINVLTEMDDRAVESRTTHQLIKQFGDHTELDEPSRKALIAWMNPAVSSKRRSFQYDRKAMKKMLTSGAMPYSLMDQLQRVVFGGELLMNNFVLVCGTRSAGRKIPAKFPVLLAIALSRYEFERGESVYEMHDLPYNIYLVLNGTFACVGRPGHNGGYDVGITKNVRPSVHRHEMKQLQKSQTKGSLKFHEEGTASTNAVKTVSPTAWDSHISNGALKHLSTEPPSAPVASPRQIMYPYKLFGRGSYFGDFEVITPLKTTDHYSRKCNVRCESEIGTVLVLERTEVVNLLQDFPHYGEAWFAAARSSERARVSSLKRLTHSSSKKSVKYKHFAAIQIQEYWRSKRHKKGERRKAVAIGRMDWMGLTQKMQDENGDPEPFFEHAQNDDSSNHMMMQREVKTLRRDMRDMKEGLNDMRSMFSTLNTLLSKTQVLSPRSSEKITRAPPHEHVQQVSEADDPATLFRRDESEASIQTRSKSITVHPPEFAPPNMLTEELSEEEENLV